MDTNRGKEEKRGKRRTCGPGSAVVETLQRGRRVDDVAAGEDVNLTGNYLAIITTTIRITLVFHWRHCFRLNPGLSDYLNSSELSRMMFFVDFG